MKNFFLALLVFLIWGGISLVFLHHYGSFEEYLGKYNQSEVLNNSGSEAVLEVDIDFFVPNASVYTDNSLLSDEMKTTVNSIRDDSELDTIVGKSNTTNYSDSTILNPTFEDGELIIDRPLIEYGKNLKKYYQENTELKVTIIGHFNDETTSLDNYFEGLKRANQIKKYITENFKIPEIKFSAISEGGSRPLTKSADNDNLERNNRIEILIED
ncbi:MAG: OmpA family protein [Leeuwenhoekiella sp.]